MKIFSFSKQILVSFLILICLPVVTYSQVFPFEEVPEDAIKFEAYKDRKVLTDDSLVFLDEYMKGLIILPGSIIKEDYNGNKLVYYTGVYRDTNGEYQNDETIRNEEIKNWICSEQQKDQNAPKFASNQFCDQIKVLGISDSVIIEDNNSQVESSDNSGNTQFCENGDSSFAIRGKEGKDYIRPVNDYVSKQGNYGDARKDDAGNIVYYHQGVDYSTGKIGPTIYAGNNGRVVFRGDGGPYGNLIIIEHKFEDRSEFALYAHMQEFIAEMGEYLQVGDKVGLVGSTGNSTGPHLHFEIRKIRNQWDGKCKINGASCNSNIDPATVTEENKIDELKNYIISANNICEEKIVENSNQSKSDNKDIPTIIDKVAKSIGNVPPEALYAILKNESSSCPLTWATWYGIEGIENNTDLNALDINISSFKKGTRDTTLCTGNANQVAFASKNLYTNQDVRGVSQIVDTTFNSVIVGEKEKLMNDCVKSLGIEDLVIKVPPKGNICRSVSSLECINNYYGYDNKSAKPERFSRHIVGHAICAQAIKLRYDGGDKPISEWDNKTVYNVAWDYYGHGANAPMSCDEFSNEPKGDYCDKALDNYLESIENKMF